MENETPNKIETLQQSLKESLNHEEMENITFEVNGSNICRDVITDTYISLEKEDEEEMLKKIDDDLTQLHQLSEGIVGMMSFLYTLLTLHYINAQYVECYTIISSMRKCVDDMMRVVFTKTFQDENGNPLLYKNLSFGNNDEKSKEFIESCAKAYNIAKYVHIRSMSFESGYSFITSSMLYYVSIGDYGSINNECQNMNELLNKIELFIKTKDKEKTETEEEIKSE